MSPLAAVAATCLATMAGSPPVHLKVHETIDLQRAEVTAAFAIDPAIVETSTQPGHVQLSGKSPGETEVTMASGEQVTSFRVFVERQSPKLSVRTDSAPGTAGVLQTGFDSELMQVSTGIDLRSRAGADVFTAQMVNVTPVGERTAGQAVSSFPAASLSWSNADRELVLLDKRVEHTPLTLDGTVLRGLHFRDGGLEFHAGATSAQLYESVVLPADPEIAAGLSYRWQLGTSSVMPSVYAFPTQSHYGGTAGVMGSLTYAFGKAEDPFHLRAELGYGGKPGGALEMTYQDGRQRLWIEGRYQPSGFASIGLGNPHGSFADGLYSCTLSRVFLVNLSTSFARYELTQGRQQTGAATAEVRASLGPRWTVSTSPSFGTVSGFGLAQPVRSLTAPLGVTYQQGSTSLGALYRYQFNSATNIGGSGGRVNAQHVWNGLSVSGSVDFQQDAATVDLVLRDDPELARLFTELGLSAQTPEELARVLRENPALIDLGYVEGMRVNLHPWHLRANAEMAWTDRGDSRQQLRTQLLYDRSAGTAVNAQTALASLSYSRKIAGNLDGMASVAVWTRSLEVSPSTLQASFSVGLRLRFDEVPPVSDLFRPREVSGVVLRDDAAHGTPAPGAAGVAGVVVTLDGGDRQLTDELGRFRFTAVRAGTHRVSAELPAGLDAFFTTGSSTVVEAGARVQLAVAYAPARLSGCIRNDAGGGLAGVAVQLSGGGAEVRSSSGSDGCYAFATAPGEYVLSFDPATLPSGYDSSHGTSRPVRMSRALRARSDFLVIAQRSIAGSVGAALPAAATVSLTGTNHQVRVGPDGRFAFRNLLPGRYTVQAQAGGHLLRREVELPEGPVVVRGLLFDARLTASVETVR